MPSCYFFEKYYEKMKWGIVFEFSIIFSLLLIWSAACILFCHIQNTVFMWIFSYRSFQFFLQQSIIFSFEMLTASDISSHYQITFPLYLNQARHVVFKAFFLQVSVGKLLINFVILLCILINFLIIKWKWVCTTAHSSLLAGRNEC